MNTPAAPWAWRVLLRNLLGSLGLLGSAVASAAATPPPTDIGAPAERVLLEERVAAVRKFYAREESDGKTETVAQWWPNWPNWSNWRNWFNGR